MSLQGEIRSTSVQESGSALRSILISFAITLVSLFGFAESALAQIVVNTTADYAIVDPDANQTVTSLREGLQNSFNFCDGPCTIIFNITTDDPGYDGTTFTITLDKALGALPPLPQSDLYIDGTSQATFLKFDSNPNGPEIVIDGSQLDAPAHGFEINDMSNCTIDHLVIQGFPGHGILIIGGLNFTSNNAIFRSYIGTNAQGSGAAPNAGDGIHLTSFVTSTRIFNNLISGNTGYGVYAGLLSGDNLIDGNAIGADASLLLPLGNGLGGIYLDSPYNRVGFDAFRIGKASTETANLPMRSRPIGRDEAEQPSVGILTHAPIFPGGNVIAFNNGPGVLLDNGAQNNTIYGNLIRENTKEGVLVTDSALGGNTITENDILLNGALGVDLGGTVAGGDGETANDGFSGAGPNDLADYPIITSAVYDGSTNTTTIQGTYQDSNYPQSVRIEVFSNDAPDPSDFGEGESYLGFDDILITGFPDVWTYVHTGDLSGMFATANATLQNGSTSEFSEAVLVQSLDVGIVKTGPATVIAGQPITYTLTATNYGPVTGGAVTVTDPLPGVGFMSVGFVSTTNNSWVCGESPAGTVTCTATA
ncbi:MAG: right-handed parallel beta-helix repeat-containing protein, partial [Thermoanaerobaculia bacterium]